MSFQDIIYIHGKGHLYRIIHFGLDEETMEPEVAYRQCDRLGQFLPGVTWHRSCTKFFDGRYTVFEDPDPDLEDVQNIFIEQPPVRPAPELIVDKGEPEVSESDDFTFASLREASQSMLVGASHVKVEFPMDEVLALTERRMGTKGVPYEGVPPKK